MFPSAVRADVRSKSTTAAAPEARGPSRHCLILPPFLILVFDIYIYTYTTHNIYTYELPAQVFPQCCAASLCGDLYQVHC